MKFISYAQNFEDVLLWRALRNIKDGVYIDVGANDPIEHSVTKAFYDAGWSGINVEPLPKYASLFRDQRPRDINLQVAAGASEGQIKLYDVPATNGWATNDIEIAKGLQNDGHVVIEHIVEQRTLNSIFAEYTFENIHFLKIDVEGFELEVLKGIELSIWRPWIIVVEATVPNSQVLNHHLWENRLTESSYHFANFDGLNRYYVASEHIDLLEILKVPVNVFDNFISFQLKKTEDLYLATEEKLSEARKIMEQALQRTNWVETQAFSASALFVSEQRITRKECVRLSQELEAAEHEKQKLVHEEQKIAQEYQAVLHSRSWRLTRPLRWVTKKIAIYRSRKTSAEFIKKNASHAETKDVQTVAHENLDLPLLARQVLNEITQNKSMKE